MNRSTPRRGGPPAARVVVASMAAGRLRDVLVDGGPVSDGGGPLPGDVAPYRTPSRALMLFRTSTEGTTMTATLTPAPPGELVEADRHGTHAVTALRAIDPRHPHIDPRHGDCTLGEVDGAAVTALLWAAADGLGAADRTLLQMQLGLGLEPAEVAAVLGTTPAAADQRLFQMRRRLARAVPARLLWDAGEGGCRRLQVALRAAGIGRFGARAVRAIAVHVAACDGCAHAEDRLLAEVA
ncbi:hypothetical protein BH24ACT4_BH24ACT4_13380 [soil metagenome]